MKPRGRRLRPLALTLAAAVTGLVGCRKDSAPSALARELAARSEAGTHEVQGLRYALPYRLFAPKDYDPRRSYPLILYLHHAGGRGSDNLGQLNEELAALVSPAVQAIEPNFVLAPQCPLVDQWVNAAREPPPYKNYVQASVPEADVAKLALDLVRAVEKTYPIDPRRVYVTGSSMGASGAWDYTTRHPGLFAAAVPINGINDPGRAAVIAGLPIWAFHGERDPVSSVENTRAMVVALRQLGSAVKYTELAGAGHDIGPSVLRDAPELYRWLFAQRLAR